VLPRYLTERSIPFRIAEPDSIAWSNVSFAEGATMCSLCSRLRRGVLYRVAGELGATQDRARPPPRRPARHVLPQPVFRRQAENDAAEARLRQRQARLIRPLAYVRERDLARFAEVMAFPAHPLHAVRLAGEFAAQAGRPHVARLGEEVSRRVESIYNALGKVETSHLMDRRVHDFLAVRATGRPEPDGDIAFDVDAALERATEMAAASAV
jgi:tRNA 2-thiocytidine biosynthesis protein TtcA